jgi:dienelactone hydrolase
MCRQVIAVLALVLLLGSAPPALHAQKPGDKSTLGDELIYKYLCSEADRLSGKYLDGAKTLDQWKDKRRRLHPEFVDMLGLWPEPERTPLKAVITGTIEHQGVVIDNLHFQSKPGLYVTANLYRPKSPPAKKLPAILYVCGHAGKGRDGGKTAFQDHGMWFASNGYVCLILDTLQLGEIPGVHHGTYGQPWRHLKGYGIKDKDGYENRFWWHSAGYTPAGVECWNGVRALDYLVSRDDVDAERLGVTGISGGGAATFWIAAYDPRVKVAVPVSGMSDLQCYIKDKLVNNHCDCMFLYNTYQWDWTTIAALIAPRPLLFANSDNDPIFPMDGNRRIIDKLNKLYALYGKPNLVDEYVSKGSHEYRPDLRVAVFRFFNKHLKNDIVTPVQDADFKPIPGKMLRVFPEDGDIPKDALNAKIDETFVPRAHVKLPAMGKFTPWKKALLKDLKEMSFGALPAQVPEADINAFGGGLQTGTRAHPGVPLSVGTRDIDPKAKAPPTLFLLNPEENFKDIYAWEQHNKGDYSRLLYFKSHTDWTKKSPPNYVERSLALLGQTPDSIHVYNLIATMRALAKQSQGKYSWRLVGQGQQGVLAAYAALFEPSIKEVVVINPPKSHQEGPYFLNVLRVLDLPEALGLLAPTPLTLINAQDPAFDRTVEIYKLAGASDKLTRK